MKRVYIDLSHPIKDGDIPYPGDPPTEVEQHSTIENDHYNLKKVSFSTHSATHIDAPSHLVQGGKSIDLFPPSTFFSTAYVLDCRGLSSIETSDVGGIPPTVTTLLFSTGWYERWNTSSYYEDPPLLTLEATRLLLERGVRMFGFDSASCDALASEQLPIHHLIFSSGGLIIENLTNLDMVVGKIVALVALPLRLFASDGSPARVIASHLL